MTADEPWDPLAAGILALYSAQKNFISDVCIEAPSQCVIDKKGGVTSEFSLTIQQTGVSGRSKKLDVECNSDPH